LDEAVAVAIVCEALFGAAAAPASGRFLSAHFGVFSDVPRRKRT